jgi:hypothetical protein
MQQPLQHCKRHALQAAAVLLLLVLQLQTRQWSVDQRQLRSNYAVDRFQWQATCCDAALTSLAAS